MMGISLEICKSKSSCFVSPGVNDIIISGLISCIMFHIYEQIYFEKKSLLTVRDFFLLNNR